MPAQSGAETCIEPDPVYHARCEMYTIKDKPSLYQDSRPILDACRHVTHSNCPAQLCVRQSAPLQQC